MSSIANSNDSRSGWSQMSSPDAARKLPTIVSELVARFHTLRWRYARWCLAIALASSLATWGFLWLLLAVSDYYLELPLWFRRAAFASACFIVLAGIAWGLANMFMRAAVRRFAMQMENRFESMGQRLRTLLDLESGKLRAPDAMLAALGHQTMARWETAQPAQILPRRFAILSATGLLVSLVSLGLWHNSGPEAYIAMQRAAGWDRSYTELVVTPGEMRLLEGLQPEVQLTLRGRPNRRVVLRYRRADQTDWTEQELTADQPNAELSDNKREAVSLTYTSKLDKLTADMQYQFDTAVGASPVYPIHMQPKIVLIEGSALVKPPAYTQLPERSFGTDDITVLVGSDVTISLKISRPLKTARLAIGPKIDQLEDVSIASSSNGVVWQFALPSDRTIHWRFSGSGEDDAPLPTITGKLRVRADEAPRIDWQTPADEMTVNMLAEVPMSVLVSDDYGLTHVGIAFQLGDNEEFVLKEWTIDTADSAAQDAAGPHKITTRVRLDEILPLESFALTEREFVSYFAFAVDNRQGGGQHAESEVRYLDIRPLKQFFSEVDVPQRGGGGRGFPVLGELISRERYLYNRTRSVSRTYDANNSDQLRTLERMVETQSELANYTRFMIDFLASQGNDDNEALGQAEAAMLQASDALATADFDTAILREQDAIRQLVEAKNTLNVQLSKFNNPAQRLQLNNFQRQLVNRLRRRTKPADTKIADDIKQIAADQRQLSKDVAEWLKQSSGQAAPTAQVEPAAAQVEPAAAQPEPTEPAQTQAASDSAAQAPQASREDQLKASQQELLDRLSALNSDLSEPLKQSSLANQRFSSGLEKIDALNGMSSKGQWQEFPEVATSLARELMELGEQIKALAEREPSRRIAGLRDLTASLAEKELEFSHQSDRSELSDPSAPADKLLTEGLKDRAKAIDGRAQTIEDLLKIPMDTGDLRASDIVDQLEKLIDEHELRSRLQASSQSARSYIEGHPSVKWLEATRDRAREFAHTAEMLDQLHRQLIAPRVEQLRRMENRAAQLAQAMNLSVTGPQKQTQAATSGTGGATPSVNRSTGSQSEKDEEDKDIRNMRMQLQAELQSAGLIELAEMLSPGAGNQSEQAESNQSGAAGNNRGGLGRDLGGAANQFTTQRMVQGHRNVLLVRQRLQELLQELVLLETTIDRSMPVPAKYKELVDEYYKSLAGERE